MADVRIEWFVLSSDGRKGRTDVRCTEELNVSFGRSYLPFIPTNFSHPLWPQLADCANTPRSPCQNPIHGTDAHLLPFLTWKLPAPRAPMTDALGPPRKPEGLCSLPANKVILVIRNVHYRSRTGGPSGGQTQQRRRMSRDEKMRDFREGWN